MKWDHWINRLLTNSLQMSYRIIGCVPIEREAVAELFILESVKVLGVTGLSVHETGENDVTGMKPEPLNIGRRNSHPARDVRHFCGGVVQSARWVCCRGHSACRHTDLDTG